jgi:basic membrane lipoprotein Med (substrate-binding protein (PBP1-ABC) superfamily)
LGPLEASVDDRVLELGGGKQRAVLAALLLRLGEIVPVEQLVDDVWDEDGPPSAAHSLEAYISRLRQTLTHYGVALEREGRGYRLELSELRGYRLELSEPGLDSVAFEELLAEASGAAERGEQALAAELAAKALGLWRGSALANVALYSEAAVEVTRLEELRLRALEIRVDADLALGRHSELVGELRPVVEANPYRERVVAQLSLALYRCGRQAEALEVYEATRAGLADELGLQPSEALQRLAGEIVRHEPTLAAPGPVVGAEPPRRRARLALGVPIAVGAAAAAAIAFQTTHIFGTSGAGGTRGPIRVALIVPRETKAGREDTFVTPFVDGLLRAARDYNLQTATLALDQSKPEATARRISKKLRTGNYDLVLSAGLGAGFDLAGEVRGLPKTRFVYIDASLRETLLEGRSNATGLPFADDSAGYLAGYLGGLVVGQEAERRKQKPVVSVVGGLPAPNVTQLVRGFTRGARQARPGIRVRVEYSGTFSRQSICEHIANRQIDNGSTLVFAAAGTCGLGALSAAELRGVWGVGADADRSYLGSHILVSTVKRYDLAVQLAVRWWLQGSLPRGKDVLLGLDDGTVGVTGISPEVAPSIRQELAHRAASLREAEATADE